MVKKINCLMGDIVTESGTEHTFYQIYKTINNQQRKSQHLKQRTVNEQLKFFALTPRLDCQRA